MTFVHTTPWVTNWFRYVDARFAMLVSVRVVHSELRLASLHDLHLQLFCSIIETGYD
jgi:hypothetical protein